MADFIAPTKELKEQIYSDYALLLPDMQPLKSKYILRQRVGPILRMLHVEFKVIETYQLSLSHNCLLDDYISGFSQYLLSTKHRVKESIDYRFHSIQYVEIIGRLKNQSLIPFNNSIYLSDVFKGYDVWMTDNKYYTIPYFSSQYQHIILLLVWAKQHKLANEALSIFCDKITKWPEDRIEFYIGTVDSWRQKQLKFIQSPDNVLKKLEDNIKRFKLTNTTYWDLTIDIIDFNNYLMFK